MKKVFIFLFVIVAISSAIFATNWVNVGISHEYGGLNRTFINGGITIGSSLISIDVIDQLQLSDLNPFHWNQIYTYIDANIYLWDFDLYAGFSPTFYFYLGQFQSADFMTHGYLQGGISIGFSKWRVYGEISYRLYYSPFFLDNNIPSYSLGAQISF